MKVEAVEDFDRIFYKLIVKSDAVLPYLFVLKYQVQKMYQIQSTKAIGLNLNFKKRKKFSFFG